MFSIIPMFCTSLFHRPQDTKRDEINIFFLLTLKSNNSNNNKNNHNVNN